MQIDGEPWEQGPGVVTLSHLNQTMMLTSDIPMWHSDKYRPLSSLYTWSENFSHNYTRRGSVCGDQITSKLLSCMYSWSENISHSYTRGGSVCGNQITSRPLSSMYIWSENSGEKVNYENDGNWRPVPVPFYCFVCAVNTKLARSVLKFRILTWI
jgi:hypothetical protein